MGISLIRLLRAIYRVTIGKLFPCLFKYMCLLVFKDEYLRLQQQSERFATKLELLERGLVEIFDHSCTTRPKLDATSDAPAISVIMPTYNRALHRRCYPEHRCPTLPELGIDRGR